MFQVIQYNDDEGNQTVAVGEDVDALRAEAVEYHREQYDENLTWGQSDRGQWQTPYKYGVQYVIESVKVV